MDHHTDDHEQLPNWIHLIWFLMGCLLCITAINGIMADHVTFGLFGFAGAFFLFLLSIDGHRDSIMKRNYPG